jgi:hypothetical protein
MENFDSKHWGKIFENSKRFLPVSTSKIGVAGMSIALADHQ